jgi:hypothetical protein
MVLPLFCPLSDSFLTVGTNSPASLFASVSAGDLSAMSFSAVPHLPRSLDCRLAFGFVIVDISYKGGKSTDESPFPSSLSRSFAPWLCSNQLFAARSRRKLLIVSVSHA